jgi:hypothetical protein
MFNLRGKTNHLQVTKLSLGAFTSFIELVSVCVTFPLVVCVINYALVRASPFRKNKKFQLFFKLQKC